MEMQPGKLYSITYTWLDSEGYDTTYWRMIKVPFLQDRTVIVEPGEIVWLMGIGKTDDADKHSWIQFMESGEIYRVEWDPQIINLILSEVIEEPC